MDIDKYYSIAIGLLFKGTFRQKKFIRYLIANYDEERLSTELINYINLQITMGGIELN